MRILTFDLGIVNPAYCLFEITETENEYSIRLIQLEKDNWKKDPYHKIMKIIDEASPSQILVEHQGYKSGLAKLGSFIMGYSLGKNIEFAFCSPIAYGLKISKYSDRKKYSINLFKRRLIKYNLNYDYSKYNDKLDDVADAFNLCFREVKKLINTESNSENKNDKIFEKLDVFIQEELKNDL